MGLDGVPQRELAPAHLDFSHARRPALRPGTGAAPPRQRRPPRRQRRRSLLRPEGGDLGVLAERHGGGALRGAPPERRERRMDLPAQERALDALPVPIGGRLRLLDAEEGRPRRSPRGAVARSGSPVQADAGLGPAALPRARLLAAPEDWRCGAPSFARPRKASVPRRGGRRRAVHGPRSNGVEGGRLDGALPRRRPDRQRHRLYRDVSARRHLARRACVLLPAPGDARRAALGSRHGHRGGGTGRGHGSVLRGAGQPPLVALRVELVPHRVRVP